MREFRVAIIGAGLAGLALAQALNRNGIGFDIYERDPSANSRIQGYRLRIDAEGQQALAELLPWDLHRLIRQTASQAATSGRFLTPQLEEATHRAPESWHQGSEREDFDLSVNRQTLREILMCGIAGNIHFGCKLERYRVLEDGCVWLLFENSDPVICDVLVGADGVHSSVRRCLAPDAAPQDTGAVCIYGKSELDSPRDPKAAYAGTNVIWADGYSVIMDEMRFGDELSVIGQSIAARCGITNVADYLYWAIIAPRERLGPLATDRFDLGEAALGDLLSSLTHNWHPTLRRLIVKTDPSVVAIAPVKRGRPDIAWAPGPVTLLGDAAHAMSPAGGVGANTAFKDALALADALTDDFDEARTLPRDLVHAIGDYEHAMREAARIAVSASDRAAEMLFGRSRRAGDADGA